MAVCPQADLCSQGTFTAMELLAALRRKAGMLACKSALVGRVSQDAVKF